MIFHKFKNKQTELDGIKFSSKKEAKHYGDLKIALQSGEVVFFLRQVPFHLDGGVKYLCDFVEFWKDGSVLFVDTKGYRTPMYILKKKQVEARYPIEITEI